jgi:hypothetical protein
MNRLWYVSGLALLFQFCLPLPALAYLDPGTGSMLVSALVGVSAALLFAAKGFWQVLAGWFYRLSGRALPRRGGLVFYSEGRQYWLTFKPVLEELERRGEAALYLASDRDDPGLAREWEHIATRCIGMGSRGFAVMNMLEAEICVMTTPGLDVLQIRRSPGVKRYLHLMHAVTDAAFYKLYAFDWFDGVMCAGPHQMRSLRCLEEKRGLPPKLLWETGCCYMDALAEELEKTLLPERTRPAAGARAGRPLRLLLAPTWGSTGLFSRFGADLLLPLVRAGHSLCLRPHPQSFISEKPLLRGLKELLKDCPDILWDDAPSPLAAMLGADALISDLSGIVFDYAFILERPAVTVAFEPDKRGKDAADLPWRAWELEALPDLGAHIQPEEVADLPRVLAALPEAEEFARRMRALRGQSLFNFRQSGRAAAEQILELRRALRRPGPP